jgi:hypothetical protein
VGWVNGDQVRISKGVWGGCLVALGSLLASIVPPAAPAGAVTSASTLYKEALATTKAWSVHYASDGTLSKAPFLESGDAGPTAGTQTVLVGSGTTADSANLIVIGDLTYMSGNTRALEDLIGLTATEAAEVKSQWVLFSTNNRTYSAVVAGVRSHDVAQEIAVKGPYTLGQARTIDGFKVDAIEGTQKLQGAKVQRVVLYVRAKGTPLIVEEDTINAKGQSNGLEHMVFSKWGEAVKPMAPPSTITLGGVNAT